jgi:hypothetical protein
MFHAIALAAHRLDLWLQTRLGRPYNVILGVGLVTEIIHRLGELPRHAALEPGLLGAVALILVNLALLVHQIGEFSHHTGRARARRDARQARRTPRES